MTIYKDDIVRILPSKDGDRHIYPYYMPEMHRFAGEECRVLSTIGSSLILDILTYEGIQEDEPTVNDFYWHQDWVAIRMPIKQDLILEFNDKDFEI